MMRDSEERSDVESLIMRAGTHEGFLALLEMTI